MTNDECGRAARERDALPEPDYWRGYWQSRPADDRPKHRDQWVPDDYWEDSWEEAW